MHGANHDLLSALHVLKPFFHGCRLEGSVHWILTNQELRRSPDTMYSSCGTVQQYSTTVEQQHNTLQQSSVVYCQLACSTSLPAQSRAVRVPTS